MIDTVTELATDEEWIAAVVEQRKRVAFDAHPRIKAARRALKATRRAPYWVTDETAERKAWHEFTVERDAVLAMLNERARRGEFNP